MTNEKVYEITANPTYEEPFISEEARRKMKREVRNKHQHNLSCAKARKKRRK